MSYKTARSRGLALSIPLLIALAANGVAQAEPTAVDTNEASSVSLTFELKDGSVIRGVPETNSLEISTAYGKMNLPLNQVDAIESKADVFLVRLINGDELKATGALPEIKIKAIFGDTSIPPDAIERLLVDTRGRGEPASLRKGLVLHYRFDREGEKAEDLSDKKNHGTVKGPVLKREKGRRGVLVLDGEKDRVEVANNESLELTQAITLSAWIKLKSFGPGGYGNEYGFIISKGRAIGINNTWILGYSKGSSSSQPRWPAKPGPYPVVFHVGGSPRDALLRSKTKIATEKWYHLVGTYDGTTSCLYINGKLDVDMAKKSKVRSDNAPILIGGSNLSGATFGNHFTVDGTIDEVRIYNRALSKDEVRRLYQATR
jgi:hypothetical protein